MREVIFTEDFATKKKGEVWLCDSMLAAQLVSVDKVAKYKDEPEVKKAKKAKDTE